MTRKVRSDCTVGSLEKKLNIPNCITNPSGRNTRSDKLIKNLRKDFEIIKSKFLQLSKQKEEFGLVVLPKK